MLLSAVSSLALAPESGARSGRRPWSRRLRGWSAELHRSQFRTIAHSAHGLTRSRVQSAAHRLDEEDGRRSRPHRHVREPRSGNREHAPGGERMPVGCGVRHWQVQRHPAPRPTIWVLLRPNHRPVLRLVLVPHRVPGLAAATVLICTPVPVPAAEPPPPAVASPPQDSPTPRRTETRPPAHRRAIVCAQLFASTQPSRDDPCQVRFFADHPSGEDPRIPAFYPAL